MAETTASSTAHGHTASLTSLSHEQGVRINPNEETLSPPSASSWTIAGTTNSSADGNGRASSSKRRPWMKNPSTELKRPRWTIPQSLRWISANYTWSNVKPVIRCAVAAWLSVILFVIPKLETFMGQASFLILLSSFFSPPAYPFMQVLERELLLLLFSTLAWAWCCLGIFLAWLARSNKGEATLHVALSGQFMEAGPTAIIGVFVFIGSAFFLFIRRRQGPGPYLFPCVEACLTLDMTLQAAILFPNPYYRVGKSVMLAFSLHSGVALLCSILIFPESISSQYTKRLQGVLSPLATALEMHRSILRTPHDSPEFQELCSQTSSIVGRAEGALIPVAAAARLLKSDLVYSRYAPGDFQFIQGTLGRLIGCTTGMGMYFSLIDPTPEQFPMTPVPSLPPSPIMSRMPSRQPSLERSQKEEEDGHTEGGSSESATLPHGRDADGSSYGNAPSPSPHQSSYNHTDAHSHPYSSHHRADSRSHVVDMFEMPLHLNLEASWSHTPFSKLYTRRMLELLRESCDELLGACSEAVTTTRDWLGGVLRGRFNFWVSSEQKQLEREQYMNKLKLVRGRLLLELEHFRLDKRHLVLDPYKQAFEETDTNNHTPPHRYLIHCYVYQYHLTRFGDYMLAMLDNIARLEEKRRSETIWTPVQYLFRWNDKSMSENMEKDDEENPESIEGMEDSGEHMRPRKRDPDALPPSNMFESIADHLYHAGASLSGGNVLYAVKAGVLSVLLFLPSFFRSTAPFAYRERFVWITFMGQLTLARFRGDTTSALVSRIMSTFSGGVIGMAMWYISAGGNPQGNVYGFAAVCAVCLPLLFYARLYWPVAPLTNVILFLTVTLVIGFSYQDVHLPLPNSPGVGFTVAWRRFVLVVAGVTAAYISSFLPPSTTIRKYHRQLVATTCSEIGTIYCQIISFANSRRQTEVPEILTNLLAIRRKLRKAQTTRKNVQYEVSFRGKWPAKRYLTILEIQLQITFALSNLMSIVEHLEPSWSRAFLRRTRFNDTDFQGDILAVITMISAALRTGHPLPQITPCPLLDRFMLRYDGIEVIHKEIQDNYGFPKQLTIDTLRNEQYMIFCVGVSTAFSIMTRLDRLMVAAKEVVGEQYYMYGMGLGHQGKEMESKVESIQLGAPGVV